MEYKKLIGVDSIKGIVPEWYHKKKSIQNKEYTEQNRKNLVIGGENTRFKEGQKGLGVYRRSKETMERLKTNNFKTKSYES